MGTFEHLVYNFFVKGHTKNSCDRGFGHIRKHMTTTDCRTVDQVVDAVKAASSSSKTVRISRDTGVLEYEDADSELADEDLRSTTASIENIGDDATVFVENMDDAASAEEDIAARSNCVVSYISNIDSYISGMFATDDEDQDSDSSLEYESNGDEADPLIITTIVFHEKMKYISVGFYDMKEMAERSLHQLNQFVYSYKTRYVCWESV
ncbi:hypothetical protein PC110_g7188 [Phytophthora cactorum]|uniref:Uncharacterized protein n=1 Tax=Phytophthora cactorum TaxID=29920 RepID=A0A329SIK5_9STRA|nr:hypothetical protein PC110_g7188 [Phytophthora cactorum]